MKHITERDLLKQSGIYKISNTINSKIYIGSSIRIIDRYYSHKNKLKSNNHANPILQSFSNKYGIDKLVFDVLEFCSKEKLIEREQYWINYYNCSQPNGFNCRSNAENNFGYHIPDKINKKAVSKRKKSLGYIKQIKDRRIPDNIRKKIRKMYSHYNITQTELGNIFGHPKTTIKKICEEGGITHKRNRATKKKIILKDIDRLIEQYNSGKKTLDMIALEYNTKNDFISEIFKEFNVIVSGVKTRRSRISKRKIRNGLTLSQIETIRIKISNGSKPKEIMNDYGISRAQHYTIKYGAYKCYKN